MSMSEHDEHMVREVPKKELPAAIGSFNSVPCMKTLEPLPSLVKEKPLEQLGCFSSAGISTWLDTIFGEPE